MIHLLVLVLTTSGFALLCVARDRHQRVLIGRRLSARAAKRTRYAGIACLALAYPVATNNSGWAHGTLEWVALTSVGAVLVMAGLTVRSARNSAPR
ncbi:DUF3325 domain-containing protein [Pelagerythrobacter sp.]|uniref:DUF3325 domain-containing protein n=1 Tax=Pelagerythrobacter sp. TaxID=2800702 RepID=UPI0035B32843